MLKLITLVCALCIFGVGAHAQQYDLLYNPNDGSLTITGVVPFDDNGTVNRYEDDHGGLLNYTIISANRLFLESVDLQEQRSHLLPINRAIIEGTEFILGDHSSSPLVIGATNVGANEPFFGFLKPEMPLGFVLPAGLTEEEFQTALIPIRTDESPKYVTSLGRPKQNFNLVYAPEPTSLALMGIGGLLLSRRRSSAS